MVAQRQAREVALIEIGEVIEDRFRLLGDLEGVRIARQLNNALSIYGREEQLIRAVTKLGPRSDHVKRMWSEFHSDHGRVINLDEYRKERRFAAGNDEPSA